MRAAAKTRHDVLSEFRCGQILSAARKVFSEKGYQEATMDEIAAMAGVAKGTLYSYFPSKRDVYVAELSRGGAELLELTKKVVSSPGDLESKIQMFIRTRVEYLDSHIEFFKIYQSEIGNMTHPAWVSQKFRDVYAEQLRMLEGMFAEAVDRGEMRALPPAVLACGIYEMTRGLLLQRILTGTQRTAEAEAEMLGTLLWKGMRPEPECD
jgi:AcrR family transcriptional regulator